MRRIVAITLILLCSVLQANAWGNRGHELVAYIAYMNLDAQTKAKVDDLVQRNPCIGQWKAAVKTLPPAQRSAALFMLAATWPDKIKLTAPQSTTPYNCPHHPTFTTKDGANGPDGRFSADIPPNIPEASQNIGYTDDRRHQYWHFIDIPISGDGIETQPANSPNVLTELVLLSKALGSDEDPQLRSYDMVWIEHLTGDIHQPLHDAQRFTKALPNGDAGGNLVHICSGDQKCRRELHADWDGLPGSNGTLSAVIKQGSTLNAQTPPSAATIDIDHPEKWADDANKLAVADAYAAPFNTSAATVDPAKISAKYHTKAMEDMRAQVYIAGIRLATLLNDGLKSYTIPKK